jgi:ribonuclease J
VSHSTPETVAIVIHTSEGLILYANDFKNDQESPFELPTNIPRFKELGLSKLPKLLVLDSLYAPRKEFSKSESFARDLVLSLKDSLSDKRLIVVSTFSSHLFRLFSLVDLARSLNRELVFIGRSLSRYLSAGVHVVDLSKFGRVIKYRRDAKRFLRSFDPKKYFLIVTGHQGEPEAVLSRMADGDFMFSSDDAVVFSCNVIPSPLNLRNRIVLESKLSSFGVTIFKDVHVSGHAFGLDHDFFLDVFKPDFLVPYHGDPSMSEALASLAKNKKIKVLRPRIGQRLKIF